MAMKVSSTHVEVERENRERQRIVEMQIPLANLSEYLDGMPQFVVMSGGSMGERGRLRKSFIDMATREGYSVFALYCGNSNKSSGNPGAVRRNDGTCCGFDPIRGNRKTVAMALSQLEKREGKPIVSTTFWEVVLEILFLRDGKVTLDRFLELELLDLAGCIHGLQISGISDAVCVSLIKRVALVEEEAILAKEIQQLLRPLQNVSGTETLCFEEIIAERAALRLVGISEASDTVINFLLSYLSILTEYGIKCAVFLEGIGCEKEDLFRYGFFKKRDDRRPVVLCGEDLPAMLGGDVFHVAVRGKTTAIVLNHVSGQSALCWSDYFGKYERRKIQYTVGAAHDTRQLVGGSEQKSVSVGDEIADRVPMWKIQNLAGGQAYGKNIKTAVHERLVPAGVITEIKFI